MGLVHSDVVEEINDLAVAAGFLNPAFRERLLAGIDPFATGLMPLIGVPLLQLRSDIEWCNDVERLADGSAPLRRWLENAAKIAKPLAQGPLFAKLLCKVEAAAMGQGPPPAIDDRETKEAIIFDNDLMPYSFLAGGTEVGRSVALVQTPQIVGGTPATTPSGAPALFNGSGWLIAPDLLVTNHHVVNARGGASPAIASDTDLAAQAVGARIRFDFDFDGAAGEEFTCAALEAHSPLTDLDYAILRLAKAPGRKPLDLFSGVFGNSADSKAAVNIIQHPDGGPKMIAVRNNLVTSHTARDLTYFTDTKAGSSGSPVLDDQWRVVALHRGSRAASGVQFQGKSAAFVNVGTQIAAILADVRAKKPGLLPATLAAAAGI